MKRQRVCIACFAMSYGMEYCELCTAKIRRGEAAWQEQQKIQKWQRWCESRKAAAA